jgi:hypothetical protein
VRYWIFPGVAVTIALLSQRRAFYHAGMLNMGPPFSSSRIIGSGSTSRW